MITSKQLVQQRFAVLCTTSNLVSQSPPDMSFFPDDRIHFWIHVLGNKIFFDAVSSTVIFVSYDLLAFPPNVVSLISRSNLWCAAQNTLCRFNARFHRRYLTDLDSE